MFNTDAELIDAAFLVSDANSTSSSTKSSAKIRTYTARLRHSIYVRIY